MASLWQRFLLIFKSKATRALDRAENVDETMDYAYAKQQEMLAKVRAGIAEIVTARKRLEIEQEKLIQGANKLAGQAKQALQAGNEDLARTALERKAALQVQAESLTGQISDLKAQQDKLVASEQQVNQKIRAFRTQKEVIKAQYSAAEAQVRISEAATGVGDEFAEFGRALQRAHDRTEQMTARADALGELEAAGAFGDVLSLGSGQDDIDRQLAQLSAGPAVDAELERMRAQLGAGDRPQLGK